MTTQTVVNQVLDLTPVDELVLASPEFQADLQELT